MSADLLRSGHKRTNHQKGIQAAYKADKRAQAEARQSAYSKLTKAEKLAKLDQGGYVAAKQRAKLAATK